jgi:hypothetical protein
MERITFDGVPKCSSTEQFYAWKAIARIVKPGRAGFCEDCTPEYAAVMRATGRCEHPEIVFDSHGDGCVPTSYKLRSATPNA